MGSIRKSLQSNYDHLLMAVKLLTSFKAFNIEVRNDYSIAGKEAFSLTESTVHPDENPNE
jgi:hypothetical protein